MRLSLSRTTLIFVVSSCLVGCVPKGPTSRYQGFYLTHLDEFHPPSVEMIRYAKPPASESGWQEIFDAPAHKVWQACVKVGAQYWGILDLKKEANGARRMLLVAASPPKYFGRDIKKPIDRWLAIAVEPLSPQSTRISLAWIDPEKGVTTRKPDLMLNHKREKQATGGQSIARFLAGRFLNDIEATLISEESYLKKFSSIHPIHQRRGSVAPAHRRKSRSKSRDAIRKLGRLESASIRRNHTVLDYPRLEAKLAQIVEQLASVAGPGPMIRNIYFLPTRNGNAKIVANGDLFLDRGLLENAESVDELAGLIAHELAHLYQEDHLYKQKRFQRTRATASALGGFASAAGTIASGILPLEEPKEPTPGTNVSEFLLTTEEVLASAALGVAGMLLMPEILTAARLKMGDEFVSEYTQDQELRADELATEYLWHAGYRHDGLLSYLERKNFLRLSENPDVNALQDDPKERP